MTPPGSGALPRLVPVCLAVLAIGAGSAPLPLTLEDVRSGDETELGPGPGLLHLVLFATWCPSCVAELDRLADLEQRWGDRGYRLVLVAVENRHTRDRLLKFAEQRRPPGDLLFDARGQAQRSLGAKSLPVHILLDSTGEEIARWEMLEDDLERMIESYLEPGPGGP